MLNRKQWRRKKCLFKWVIEAYSIKGREALYKKPVCLAFTNACFFLCCACAYVLAGSGFRALSWCLWASTKSWTKRRCSKAGSPTSANQCRWPIIVPCSTAARCRGTPAVKLVTVTEHKHTRTLESPALHHRLQRRRGK